MKIEVRDSCTLAITAESVAEHVLLKQFEGAVAKREDIKPFSMNVETMLLEIKK